MACVGSKCSDLSKHAFRNYSKDRLQCEQTRRHWLRPLQCPAPLTESAGVAVTAESSFGLPGAAVTGDIGTIFSACARLLARLLRRVAKPLSLWLIHVSRSSMDTQLHPRRQTLPPLPVYQTVLEKIASRRSACAGKESSFCFLFFLASFFFVASLVFLGYSKMVPRWVPHGKGGRGKEEVWVCRPATQYGRRPERIAVQPNSQR